MKPKNRQHASTFTAVLPAPFGKIGVQTDAQHLLRVAYLDASYPDLLPQDELSRLLAEQLIVYWAQPSAGFHLPLQLEGSDFQRRVWQAIQAIPPGSVQTYAELARDLGSGARAVGGACAANPLPLVIPCHRVIQSNGSLGGFMGQAAKLEIKAWLLSHEKQGLQDGLVLPS